MSKLQPVPLAQPSRSSCAVHRRPPPASQMASASSNVLSFWQPLILDFAHTEQPSRFRQREIWESEQHRTSCSSRAWAKRAISVGQSPGLPHSTKWDGSCGGGIAGGVGGANSVLDQTRRLLCLQPVFFEHPAKSSSAVQSRAPTLTQAASATPKVTADLQAPIEPFDSAHTEQPGCLVHPGVFVPEQQRTACSSWGSSHLDEMAPPHSPPMPHVT